MYRLLQLTVGPLVRLVWRLRVVGAERLPAGAVVVAANHESVLDPLIVGAALPRHLHFLAKEELWRSRLVGRLLDACGAVSVARGRGDREAVAAVVRVLAAGHAVAVFPQGTAPHASSSRPTRPLRHSSSLARKCR